jgi:hypothetical protein
LLLASGLCLLSAVLALTLYNQAHGVTATIFHYGPNQWWHMLSSGIGTVSSVRSRWGWSLWCLTCLTCVSCSVRDRRCTG